jgi:small subunit ribosomal protein S4
MQKVKEKKERALGTHLHIKGIRCTSPKCALNRKPHPPGMHGPRKRGKNSSEYGRQLKEKQKLKLTYNINERTLLRIFSEASKSKESTSAKLFELLELRLDNVLYRLGLCLSRRAGRNMIRDGHVLVNGKKVFAPGYEVKVGDVITLSDKFKKSKNFDLIKENLKNYNPPPWLKLDKENISGKLVSLPEFDFNLISFEIEPIIDLFSR